jgi:protein CpxP
MKKLAIAAALMMGVSGIALAQTSTPTSPSAPPAASTTAPPSTTAGSGSSMPSAIHTEADVKQRLEHEGYSQVTDVKKDKDGYTAKAMKGGKQVSVDVDQKGKIEAK